MLGRLLNELTNFSLTFNFFTSLPLFINAYVVFVIPSWLGLIISKKKSYYIFSIIIWGSFWMVGLVAYVGMNS